MGREARRHVHVTCEIAPTLTTRGTRQMSHHVDLKPVPILGAYWKVCTCGVHTMARCDLGQVVADRHPCAVVAVTEQGGLW